MRLPIITSPRPALALAAFLMLAACEGAAGAPATTVVERDSAGIRIVENVVDTAAVRAGWSIAPQPTFEIGGLSGPEESQIGQLRGATRLGDGRIVLADGAASEIRVFGADGAPLARWGRKGDGPGEFQAPFVAGHVAGDSIVVFDSGLRRASVLTPDSGFVRSYEVGADGGGYPVAQGILDDGTLAIGGGMSFSSDDAQTTGVRRSPSRYLLVRPDGSVRADLGELPAAEMFMRVQGGGFMVTMVPLGRRTSFAPASDHVWLGTGESWELRTLGADGALRQIVRVDRPLVPITSAMRAAAIEEQVANRPDEASARAERQLMADVPFPEELPPYTAFVVDALDHLWVGEALAPGQLRRDWTIIDPAGRVVGRVTTPARTRPLEIGEDYLLGVTTDELDVERVTVWGVGRP